ncbi:MAG: hypothetical protein SF172_08735 [Burkholderiales bacterium]|nr:hypothetical protein [Burkholderiales bacterium]
MFRRLHFVFAATTLIASAAASGQTTSFNACPFKPAELQSALGVSFSEGKAGPPLSASTVTMHSCRYESKNYTVRVESQVYQNAADAKKAASFGAGKMVPIPNDPDGAAYQEGQGDNTDPAVHYSRGNVAMHLRIMGIYYKDSSSKQKELLAIREKLAKLRRVP